MDMMRPVVVIHFTQSPERYLKIWRFLYIVIREVFWTEQRISETGSLSYFRYRGEEMYWSSANEISQTWLLTWEWKVSNFRNSAVCLECHMIEQVQNSVTWSVIHHCQNYLGNVRLWRSEVRWQTPSDDIMFRSHARVSSNKATLEIQKLFLFVFGGF
jgi:hypothetical protein